MSLFDQKNFNGEVFGKYVDRVKNLNRNELLESSAIVEHSEYASMLPMQTGGNLITVPIKARIGGTPDNYNGSTDIKSDSRATYTHSRVVVGRAHGWTEKDFSADITGEDFMPAAQEIAEYWDDVDQKTLLSILKGVFSMNSKQAEKDFVAKHTSDITRNADANVFSETTLNNAIQKALGDNKAKFSLAIMHSMVATHLENLKLLSYMKQTDANGIERDLTLATLNGRVVLIDDNMPTAEIKEGYVRAKSTSNGALKVVNTSPNAGEVQNTTVQEDISDIEEGEYVVLLPAGTAYTTYVMATGAIEYTNVGADVPYEMDRDPAKNGGETTLYSRQRKIFSPYGISWKGNALSPTDAELEAGTSWTIANSNESSNEKWFPEKAIGIAQIITRG